MIHLPGHYYSNTEYLFKLDENYVIQALKTLSKSVGEILEQKILDSVAIKHQAVPDWDNLLTPHLSCQIKVRRALKICQTFFKSYKKCDTYILD